MLLILYQQLVDRGIQPKGFFNDDAARLQEEYDVEHVKSRENRRKNAIEVRIIHDGMHSTFTIKIYHLITLCI